MLSNKDLAKLTTTLQIPLIVQDILDGKDYLDGEIQYGMHEVLSEYQPDAALLCIALSARRIAQTYQHQYANMGVMKLECDRMIEDYAALWMDHVKARPIDDNMLMDTLSDIPDDLESLAELLEINMNFLLNKQPDIAGVCDILILQARSQAIIADTFIDMMEKDTQETAPVTLAANQGASNVIPFPYYARH